MRISLAEEIREISQVTPKDFDPDEFHSEPEEQQAAATEHYLLELGYVSIFRSIRSVFHPTCNLSPSTLRKAQDSLSDPKYTGKRVSRAQLLENDNDDPPSDSQVEDSESEDESQATQEGESDTSEPTLQQQEPQMDVAQTITQTRLEDQKKGLAVSRQLVRLASRFSYNGLTF